MESTVIRVERLSKTFRQGFFMRKVEALKGVSFEVESGSIFGFLGPNGAGKTTTIKLLTGLIRPTSGTGTIFGQPLGSHSVRRRIGYLPENPYIYPYLTPAEFVEMCGALSGLGRTALRARVRQVLDQVGIGYAAERQVRRLSKGMLQRTALAAALVAEPELLILDEPMSGLDPVGRKEVREIILEERARGSTVFFSTHILSDVETLCDRVAILRQGVVVVSGNLGELVRREVQRTDVVLATASDAFAQRCAEAGHQAREVAGRLVVSVAGSAELDAVLREALAAGLSVAEVVPRHETLEDLFMREVIGSQPSHPPVAA